MVGIFVRGGVTADWIRSSDTVAFGHVPIRAYKLESELAHVRGIVVDLTTIQRFHARSTPKSRIEREITNPAYRVDRPMTDLGSLTTSRRALLLYARRRECGNSCYNTARLHDGGS